MFKFNRFMPILRMCPEDLIGGGAAANADVVDVATPEGIATPTNTDPITPAEPAIATPKEDVTATQAFSKRLAEKTAEAEKAVLEKVNATISKLGMEWNGKPITTQTELDAALAEKALMEEAAKQNVPVEILSRLTQAERDAMETKNMLSTYQRKDAIAKEAELLAVDPKWGTFYKTNEKAIRETADQLNVDLATAKLIVLDNQGVPQVNEDAIIQKYIDGKRTAKPVEGSGATPVTPTTQPKTFDEAREGARAMLRAQKG